MTREPSVPRVHDSTIAALLDKRVWVDFNSGFERTDENGLHYKRPSLETVGTREDIARLHLVLQPQLAIEVWMDDYKDDGSEDPLVATGLVDFTEEQGWFVEVPAAEIIPLSALGPLTGELENW